MKKKELSGKKRLHPLNNAENVLGPKVFRSAFLGLFGSKDGDQDACHL